MNFVTLHKRKQCLQKFSNTVSDYFYTILRKLTAQTLTSRILTNLKIGFTNLTFTLTHFFVNLRKLFRDYQ